MKKISLFILLILMWCNTTNAIPMKYNGQGNLILSEDIIKEFHSYISTRIQNNPLNFFITEDQMNVFVVIRKDTTYRGYSASGPIARNKKICEQKYKQDCFLFANQRIVVWNNNINPINSKDSKIERKISYKELIVKLNELGFIETEEKKAAQQKKLAEEKAAQEKKLAEEKAAQEKKLAEEKAAQEKKLAKEKAAQEKLNKKLSLIHETDLENAQIFLKSLQDFVKKYPQEFDIIKLSEFFILTKPILDGKLNSKSREALEQFKEFLNTSDLFVKFNNNVEKNRKVKKLNKINDAFSSLENNIKIIKGFMVTDPNSIYLEQWLNSIKNAELIIDNPSSYDQLLKTNNDLIKLAKSKNEIDEVIADLNNNIDELKEILKQNLTNELAPLILELIKLLQEAIEKETLELMKSANNEFKDFMYENFTKPKEKAAKEKKLAEEKPVKEKKLAEEKPVKIIDSAISSPIKVFDLDLTLNKKTAKDILAKKGYKCKVIDIQDSIYRSMKCDSKEINSIIIIHKKRINKSTFNDTIYLTCGVYKGCKYKISEVVSFFEKKLKIKIRDFEVSNRNEPMYCGVGPDGDKLCVTYDQKTEEAISVEITKHRLGASGMSLN